MSGTGVSRDDRTLASVASACAALVFLVVASSAWLRLAPAGLPCPPGGCVEFTLADAVRITHRVAAMGVSVLALLIAALAWKAPAAWGRRTAAVAILALVAVLAVVGRRSADSASLAVILTNLLGGLILLALTVGLATAARAPSEPLVRVATRLTATVLAVLALVAVATPAWPLAPWLHNLLASTALATAVVAVVAARGTGKAAPAPAQQVPAEP